MPQGTKARRKSPNGQAGLREGPVAERVARLREQGKTDAHAARDEAWDWIKELGATCRRGPPGCAQ